MIIYEQITKHRESDMKNLLISLLLLSTFSSADTPKDETIKTKLIETLQNLKKFKKEKNNQINELNNEIEILKKQFLKYQIQKENEIKKVNKRLKQTKHELYKSKKELSKNQEKSNEIVPNIEMNIQDAMQKAMDAPINSSTEVSIENIVLPVETNLPWIEIVVENNMDIYQLAKLYYGDRHQYIQIYTANKNVIPDDLEIRNGMSLQIPITSTFKEQPMVLNTH